MHRKIFAALVVTITMLAAMAHAQNGTAKSYVWWEGENAVRTNMTTQMAFSPANEQQANVLSEGKWLGSPGSENNEAYFAEYEIEVPRDGNYKFYVRKFWKHGPFRWRFDGGDWNEVPREFALLETSSMRTHVSVSWVKAGEVELKAGTHKLRVELLPDKSKAACFDAFLLTLQPFQARGVMKPDQKYNKAPEGWFPFEPDWDMYDESPIDLRFLNEENAGDKGFISTRGEEFIHSKTGEAVRFWAVNTGHELAKMDHDSIDNVARFLAKRGVNMVRIHGGFYEGSGPNATQIDEAEVDRIFYLVSALKKEGIYSAMSIHFQHWLNLSQDKRVKGFDAELHRPYAIHFYDPEYQAIFKGWWKAVLDTENPYTGMRLADDPAVGYCEIINEDNFFFWTFVPYERIPAEQMPLLEKMFGKWLAEKYGSIDEAFDTWGDKPGKVKGDNVEEGRVGLYSSGMLTGNDWAVNARNPKRAEDCTRFLAELEYDFFDDMEAYISDELGYGGPICGSNMSTADYNVLGPIERWTNTAVDFLDTHGYYGGAKEQADPPHFAMEVGDSYTDRSVLRFDPKGPGMGGYAPAIPFLTPVWNGLPGTCSEFAWVQPNQYQAEMTVLAATVGRTTGLDGMVFFALDATPQWKSRMNTYWDIPVPTVAGQYPAFALIYRLGLIQEGKTSVHAKLGLDKLMALEGSPIVPPKAGDDVNEQMAPSGKNTLVQGERIDPRAFVVGKVNVDFIPGADKHDIQLNELDKYIDHENKIMRSTAGDWTWNYERGLFMMEAQAVQGACGFLGDAGRIDLPAMSIESPMQYGTIVAVAMDGKPLTSSGKILLQVMSQAQDYGYEAKPETGMRKITNRGTAPIIVKDFAGKVSIKRADADLLSVTSLDFNGYSTDQAKGAATIGLKKDVLYYIIEK
ncbi:MAG: hypothetical protein ACLFUS_07830 [Candidatus Sumerlaeia bacterium]